MWFFERYSNWFGGKNPLLYLIVGIVLLIWPQVTTITACIIVGAVLCIYGIISVLQYRKSPEFVFTELRLIVGILALIGGVLLLLFPKFFLSIIPFVFGILVVVHGILEIQKALDLKRMHTNTWWVTAAEGGIEIILGLLLIFNPFSATVIVVRILGVLLIVEAFI